MASPEFQGRNTTTTEFVTLLYRVFLGRVPDAPGLTDFVTRLTQGTATRDQLVAQFAASTEFHAIQQQLFPPSGTFANNTITLNLTVPFTQGGVGCTVGLVLMGTRS